ncbi:hypothetical protein BJP35_0011 [Enterobacter sp. J49]|nr:hypothetical protein BJP35_0011 [Enterobacter sp. J49]
MRNNLRIIRAETTELHAWLVQHDPIDGLPNARNTACLLMTLRDDQIVMAEKLYNGDDARVVILVQCGHSTSPSVVWPTLNNFYITSRTRESGITVFLSGNTTFWHHQLWVRHLTLHSPGKAPVVQLLLSFFIRCFMREEWWMAGFLRRFIRRGK